MRLLSSIQFVNQYSQSNLNGQTAIAFSHFLIYRVSETEHEGNRYTYYENIPKVL